MRKSRKLWSIVFGATAILGLSEYLFLGNEPPPIEPPISQNQTFFAEQANLESRQGSEFFIEALRKRKYQGGEIKLERIIREDDRDTSYLFSYPSEDLRIVGVLNVPNGRGPFPIIILNHGYYNSKTFKVGTGTEREAKFLVQNGYVTFAPNFRGFGDSQDDGQAHLFRADFAIDVLELVASIEKSSLAFLDRERIGMWGHSMGGGISERVAATSGKIKAFALFGPVESDAWKDFNRFGSRRPEIRDAIIKDLGSYEEKPEFWKNISPINFVSNISAPLQIHHGNLDPTVPLASSREFHEALVKAGKQSEFFIYERQGHFLRGTSWNLAMKRTLDFYNRLVKGS